MSVITGSTVVELWTVLDFNSNPLTGMTSPADITFTLHRQSGTVMVLASEAVTLTEIGATGHYTISFIPMNTGLYVLQLKEINTSTLLRLYRFRDIDVVAKGAVFSPTYANAFCSESDIERWVQTEIDATTNPSAAEATGFAETRAAMLMSLMGKWGFTVTPSTVVEGSRVEDLLRRANAIGAAIDYSLAQQLSVRPSKSDRINALQVLWIGLVGDGKKMMGTIEMEVKGNLSSLSTDHILSGDTTARPTVEATDAPIGFAISDLF